MDVPCQNHYFPIHHKLHECEFMKRLITKPPIKKVKPEEVAKKAEQEATDEGFPWANVMPYLGGAFDIIGFEMYIYFHLL
jgi:hypothetical protein